MQQLTLAGTLMAKNKKLFHFTIISDFCTEFTFIEEDTSLYPYGCDPREFSNYKDNLVLFFYDRTTPPTRQFIERDLAAAGLKYYDMGALIRYQKGRSFSDYFWLIPDE